MGQSAEVANQILGVEVIVPLEDFVDDDPPLLGDAFAAALQKLLEPRPGRQRDLHRSQRKVARHENFRPAKGPSRLDKQANARSQAAPSKSIMILDFRRFQPQFKRARQATPSPV